jgi:hypothetical protein
LQEQKSDAEKFLEKGNAAAGRRVRTTMSALTKKCKEVRGKFKEE